MSEKMRIGEVEDFDDFVEVVRNVSPTKKRLIKWGVSFLIFTMIGGICGWNLHAFFNKEEQLPLNYISAKLEDASELTTQKVTYSSRVPMSDGSIPFITKKSFVMYYNATVSAGVDLSDVDVREQGKNQIIVRIPHAKILGTPNIDPNSIEFHDENKALLNWNKKDDVSKALIKAKEDFKNNPSVDTKGLLEEADEYAEELIHMLLDDAFRKHEVVVKFKK